jgi:hypothetical protein
MKIIASILMVYFGLLMLQPFVNMGLNIKNKPGSCHPSEMCCKKMAKQQGKSPAKQQSNTCNRDLCNPFVPCGISIAYRTPLHNFVNPVFEINQQLKPAINDHITSNYLADCWRPPEQLS